jgi:hypothetical protein
VRIDGRDFDETSDLYELVNLKRKLGIIIFICLILLSNVKASKASVLINFTNEVACSEI